MSISFVIIGAVLVLTGVVCIFLANYQYWELHWEINEKLPANEKFEPLFWTPVTWLKFRDLRKRVIPESPRPKKAAYFGAIGFCSFFSGVALVLFKSNF